MKKILLFYLFITNLSFGQSSILIEPNSGNGIFSKNATTALDPGNEEITLPTSGEGTRLMWIPAKSIFRVGTVTDAHWNIDSIGNWSFASGFNTIAKGNFSVAFGNNTTASSIGSFSMGNNSIALGNYSTVFGNATTAKASHSFVVGAYNVIAGTANQWLDDDPLFVVGNGTGDANRKNAFTVQKNGFTGIGIANPLAMLDVSRGNSGLGSAIIRGTDISSNFCYSAAEDTYIRGGKSTSKVIIGDLNGSVGIGLNNPSATVKLDVNGRIRVRDNGVVPAGIWFNNQSNGLTNNDGAFFGIQNPTVGSETAGIWIGNNWKFLIDRTGNSTFEGRPRVKHTVNGTAGIWFNNNLNGTTDDDGAFFGIQTPTPGSEKAGIWIGNSWKLSVDRNGNSNFMGNGTFSGTVTASCGVLVCSDNRFKKNIQPLNNALNNILKVDGVSYYLKREEFPEKNFSEQKQIGFIAQEIEKIYPEMVITDAKGYKSVDYARFTPVLVEALKEQQKMIEALQTTNEVLKNKNNKLESRLDKIEEILNK
jgi:hypothetical protein